MDYWHCFYTVLPSPVNFIRNFGAAFLSATSCVMLDRFYFGAASKVDFGQDCLTLVNIEVKKGGRAWLGHHCSNYNNRVGEAAVRR
jgi:hypothetical protein